MRRFLKRLLSTRWEILLWVLVLGVVGYRFGPQLGAALGLGEGEGELAGLGVETLDGTFISLESLRGQVVLINAWATWCPPCVLEMPGFQRVYQDYKDQGFTILGISRDDLSPQVVQEWLSRKGISYPVAMSDKVRLEGLEPTGALPTSYLVGRDGKIKHMVEGVFAEPTLRMAVRILLDDPLPEEEHPTS